MTGVVYDISQKDEIAAHFHLHGYVVAQVLNKEECDIRVCELWTNVIQKQPWRTEVLLAIKGADGRTLDANEEADRPAFVDAVTGRLSKQTREYFGAGWPMHTTFGAPCDNRSFHTNLIWEVRQHEQLYEAATAIASERDLWVDINRSIMKLPGKGDDEFLHWDYDIFSDTPQSVIGAATIQGKIMYTAAEFVCVPGTHTADFKTKFRRQYGPVYPHRSKAASKFGLKPECADPMGLVSKKQVVSVPAGCVVFWSPFLLHGHSRSPLTSPTQYGMYIGYQKAGSRPEYSRRAQTEKTELEDRLGSYAEGRAPLLWPSLDPIHYYPWKFRNFPHLLGFVIERMREDDPRITTRVNGKKATVQHLVDVVDKQYIPPKLTKLGARLLGKHEHNN